MTFDCASMDLEKAMGRVAESTATVFSLQCVTGPLERHHAKRMVQFLRKQGIVEFSLFRVDVASQADTVEVLCRYIRSSALHTIRLRSVHLQNPALTRQVLSAITEHGRFCEIVLDAAGLAQATDALVPLLEQHGGVSLNNTGNTNNNNYHSNNSGGILRKLDVSCEMLSMGPTERTLARGLQACRSLSHLRLNGCQLTDADAAALLEVLQSYGTLTHLELRKNQFQTATLLALAKLLGSPNHEHPAYSPTTDFAMSQAQEQRRQQRPDYRRPMLKFLDLASNPGLFTTPAPATNNTTEAIDPQRLSHEATDLFCQALAENCHLQYLNLRNTGAHTYVLEQVAYAMRRNRTLAVLDLRHAVIDPVTLMPATVNATRMANATPLCSEVWQSLAEWKGVETLELDNVLSTVDSIMLLQALQRNTSLVSASLEGLADEHRPTVNAIFRRNRWWKQARGLLSNSASLWYDGGRPGAWMHALSRMQSDVAAGHTATYYVLQERLSLWLESKEEDCKPAARPRE